MNVVTPNIAAFLATIRHSEGTDKYPDPYAVCFAGKFTIIDFSNHPAVLGTWHGEPLDFLGPAYVGKKSTAAGAYQIIKPTWLSLKAKLTLPDFTAPSQDDAAVQLIKEAHALDLVFAGRIGDAITACRGIWASLPGSSANQPQKSFAELINVYGNSGGGFA